VIQTRTEIVMICPAELDAPIGAAPAPAGVIKHDQLGGEYLDALIAWAGRAINLLQGAQAACEATRS
jgi:hypothetical protein